MVAAMKPPNSLSKARQTLGALRETIWIALDTLRAHKLRTFLTLLGVILAVTTLVAVISVLNGLNVYVADKVANLGANAFVIDRIGIVTNQQEWYKARKRPTLGMEDLEALRNGMKLADTIAGQMRTFADVRYGNDLSEDVMIIGATPTFASIRDIDVSNGRLLTDIDEDHRAGVCVIGADVANKLFPGTDPVGKEIRAGQGQYTIVGVATPKGNVLGQPQDNFVMIPLGTYRKELLTAQDSITFFVQARGPEFMDAATDEACMILRSRHHLAYETEDNFAIIAPTSIMGLWNRITGNAFGIAIWITSVFLVVGGVVIMNIMLASVTERTREIGLVQGFPQPIQDEIVSEGIDTAFVSRFDQGPQNGRRPKDEKLRKPLTLEDAMAVRQLCPAIKEIAVSAFQWQLSHTARYQGMTIEGTDFRGTFPAYLTVYSNATMKAGRFFTEAENEHRENVVVIGENVATTFFPTVEDAMGKEILVDGSTYLVVGVFEKPPNGFGTDDEDRRTVIPYYTFMKLYPSSYELGYRFLAYSGKLDAAVDQIREVLRRRREVPYDKPDNFSIQTQVDVVQKFNDIIGGVVLVVSVLSSIGLLIGGMGVMNIMLVSVPERTREIGVRKAIGAKRNNILVQFLIEAVTLSAIGGVIGVTFGSGITLLLKYAAHFPAALSVFWIVTALILCALIGIVFGVYPAWKAARLDPVEALRYE